MIGKRILRRIIRRGGREYYDAGFERLKGLSNFLILKENFRDTLQRISTKSDMMEIEDGVWYNGVKEVLRVCVARLYIHFVWRFRKSNTLGKQI